MKPNFICLVGLPNSGKTEFARKYRAEHEDVHIFSSDALREEMFGDVNDQTHNTELFQELHKRMKECLSEGHNVIFDATNLSSRKRKAFVDTLKKIDCRKECHVIATRYEVCLARNKVRARHVPEEVMYKMLTKFEMPYYHEGWDLIMVHYNDVNEQIDLETWLQDMKHFDQHNAHHTLSLGDHCESAKKYLEEHYRCDVSLLYAALLHDCGKPLTGKFYDYSGNPSEQMHFYGHEHASSYLSLFFDLPENVNRIYMSFLISNHMRPFLAWSKSKKSFEKDKKLFGDRIIKDIKMLHDVDLAAH